jgi:hypothetical protein
MKTLIGSIASGPTAYLSPIAAGNGAGFQARFIITCASGVDIASITYQINGVAFTGTSPWYNLGPPQGALYQAILYANSGGTYINIAGQVQIQTTSGTGTITRNFTQYIAADGS